MRSNFILESRRRKERDWSADDYYDSDEDIFFDRTGNVEKKRKTRMVKLGVTQSSKPFSYSELVKKIEELESNITKEEALMDNMREEMRQNVQYKDNLDDYMKTIDAIPNYYQTTEHKEMISKSKLKIKEMQAELIEMRRLAEIAKPTDLPALTKNKVSSIPMKKTNSVVYGKRIRLKGDLMKKLPTNIQVTNNEMQDFVEEVDSDEEPSCSTKKSSNEETKLTTETQVTNEDTKLPMNIKTYNERTPNILESCNKKTTSSTCKENNDATGSSGSTNIPNEEKSPSIKQNQCLKEDNAEKEKKMYGPMRPPANYVIPESYFDQETDRDLPEITDIDT